MKINRNRYAMPDISNLSSDLNRHSSIEINGGKVVFDHKVTLMPVNLEEIPADYRRNRKRNGK